MIDSFEKNGKLDKFRNPYSVFVDAEGQLFIADRDNQRIVCLDQDGRFVSEITSPHAGYETVFPAHFRFRPIKVVVDKLNRIFVIVEGLFEGIVGLPMKASSGVLWELPVSIQAGGIIFGL